VRRQIRRVQGRADPRVSRRFRSGFHVLDDRLLAGIKDLLPDFETVGEAFRKPANRALKQGYGCFRTPGLHFSVTRIEVRLNGLEQGLLLWRQL